MRNTITFHEETSLLDNSFILDCEKGIERYISLSKRIYNPERMKDYRRMAVFVIRALAKDKKMNDLVSFFRSHPLRSQIAAAHPCIFEQATRFFFYRDATFDERLTLIKEHFHILASRLSDAIMRGVYLGNGVTLWRQDYKEEILSLSLCFDDGQKKEGLMSVVLKIGEKKIYQAIFWVAPGPHKEPVLWIGALQGAQGELDTVRDLTKQFFGYRPKNLVIHALRTIARQLSLREIYAISNYGFYANNHIRIDRKLKTSLDDFWQETGGKLNSDLRFFDLPIIEPRKSMEQIESHKRNLYRKRFALIDSIDEAISEVLRNSSR